jgi:hypothetical protein
LRIDFLISHWSLLVMLFGPLLCLGERAELANVLPVAAVIREICSHVVLADPIIVVPAMD